MATVFLTERLMRAAQALLQHNEVIEVRYVGYGTWQDCMLIGAGDKPKTVRLAVWCSAGEILREGRHAIRFCDCLIPEATAARLEAVADAQEPLSELGRAQAFIRRARGRDGRFADCTHRGERRGAV